MFLNDLDPDARAQIARTALRNQPEQLVRLARHLPALDRRLIEQHLSEGLTLTELSDLYCRHPRTTRRHIDRLVARMCSDEFRLAALHPELLPAGMSKVAKLLFIQGRSLRETARLTRRSLHRVRSQRTALQALAQVHARAPLTA